MDSQSQKAVVARRPRCGLDGRTGLGQPEGDAGGLQRGKRRKGNMEVVLGGGPGLDESLVAFGKLWTRSVMTLLLLHEHRACAKCRDSRRGKRDT